jgi:hypothetical protein
LAADSISGWLERGLLIARRARISLLFPGRRLRIHINDAEEIAVSPGHLRFVGLFIDLSAHLRQRLLNLDTRLRDMVEQRLRERAMAALRIGRLRHEDMLSFVRRHQLNWDWVLCGDLKGRLRMARRLR